MYSLYMSSRRCHNPVFILKYGISLFQGIYFLSTSLFVFVSGENILCSDINSYRCILQALDVFNPHRNGSCPTNGIIYLSNHNLTKWILNNRTESLFNITTQSTVLNHSAEMFATAYHREDVPFIDLCGVVYLILSNNSVSGIFKYSVLY